MNGTYRRLRAAALFALVTAGVFALVGCAQKNKPEDISETVTASFSAPEESQTGIASGEDVFELPPIPLTQAAGTTQNAQEKQSVPASVPTQKPAAPATKETSSATKTAATTAAKASSTTTTTSKAPSSAATTTKAPSTTTAATSTTKAPESSATTKVPVTTTTTTASSATATTPPSEDSTTASTQPTRTLPTIGDDEDRFEIPIN